MNYAKIKKHDISNGPGVRVSLYVSGCTHHCKNCFNPETWDFSFGEPFDQSAETEILEALEPPYIKGLSLLGGEPFEPQNRSELADFVKKVREISGKVGLVLYRLRLRKRSSDRPRRQSGIRR